MHIIDESISIESGINKATAVLFQNNLSEN